MAVWVKAKTIIRTDVNGKQIAYHPGDWFEAGKYDAKNWLAQGMCEIVNPVSQAAIIPPQSGIVCSKDVGFKYSGLPITIGAPSLEYHKSIIWNPEIILNINLIPVGLGLLERWEIAIPISDYNLLAADIGTEADRAKTKAVIHDLRVPVYDTRLMYVRKSIATEELFALWDKEKIDGDESLAFLRALYQVKPYVLALPSIWCEK